MKVVRNATISLTSLIALVVCAVSLISGVSLHRSTLAQNKTYTGTTDAVVADYEVRQEEVDSADDDETEAVDMYYPIFQYTVDGKDYEEVYESGSSDKTYEENSTVKINYLPDDPSQFFVAGDKFRSYVPYALYALALISGIIVIKTLFKAVR